MTVDLGTLRLQAHNEQQQALADDIRARVSAEVWDLITAYSAGLAKSHRLTLENRFAALLFPRQESRPRTERSDDEVQP